MLRTVTIAVGLVLTPVAAFADSCPIQMAQIDAAMSKSKIPASDMSRVRQLRKQGGDLHKSGDHAASEAILADARKLLGI